MTLTFLLRSSLIYIHVTYFYVRTIVVTFHYLVTELSFTVIPGGPLWCYDSSFEFGPYVRVLIYVILDFVHYVTIYYDLIDLRCSHSVLCYSTIGPVFRVVVVGDCDSRYDLVRSRFCGDRRYVHHSIFPYTVEFCYAR